MTPTDYSQQGRCCHLYIGPTVVTCLEIRWPPGFWFSGPAPSHYSQPRAGRSATECERGRVRSALAGTPIADYSLPAAGAHPRVEARRLSIRRRADVGRCRTPVRSARAMCCLWVMSTTRHVSGVSRSLPLLRWPGQISGPGVLAGPRCLASRDQVSTRERSGHGQLQGPAFRLRSARTRPGSSVTGPAACVSSWSRVRSCNASG